MAALLLAAILCSAGVSFGLDRGRDISQYGHDTWTRRRPAG